MEEESWLSWEEGSSDSLPSDLELVEVDPDRDYECDGVDIPGAEPPPEVCISEPLEAELTYKALSDVLSIIGRARRFIDAVRPKRDSFLHAMLTLRDSFLRIEQLMRPAETHLVRCFGVTACAEDIDADVMAACESDER